MKLNQCLTGVVAFFLSAAAWAGSDIRFTEVRGDVQVKNAAGASRAAKTGEAVAPGESVLTGSNSLAILKFEDGHVIALKDDTDFAVRSYRYEAAAPAQNSMLLSLVKGGLRSLTGLLGHANKQAFELRTPNATMGIRGSDWMAALLQNNLYTGVNSGGISINNSFLLNPGQYAAATVGSANPVIVSFSQLPANVFGALPQLSIGGFTAGTVGGTSGGVAGGTAGGVAGGTAGGIAGVGAGTIGAIGAAAAGILKAVSNSDSASSHSTTTHH